MALPKVTVPRAAAGGALALAIGIISTFEGTKTESYLDIVGVPTICVGHTGPEVALGQRTTLENCHALLSADLQKVWNAEDRLITVPTDPWTRAALASFAFNVGIPSFTDSTLLKKLNAGDTVGACNEILRWTRAKTVKAVKGLIRRREAERKLCLGEPW